MLPGAVAQLPPPHAIAHNNEIKEPLYTEKVILFIKQIILIVILISFSQKLGRKYHKASSVASSL